MGQTGSALGNVFAAAAANNAAANGQTVTVAPLGATTPANSITVTGATVNSSSTTATTATIPSVTVYTGTSKSGNSYIFEHSQQVPTLTFPALGQVGPNQIESVVVSAGASITLYSGTGYTGSTQITIMGPAYMENLNEIQFNNQTQSLIVSFAATPPPVLATLYSYPNFDTTHTYASITQYGQYDNVASIGFSISDLTSITVAAGVQFTMYQNRGFGSANGPPLQIPPSPTSIANTSTVSFLNKGDSIIIQPSTTTNAPAAAGGVASSSSTYAVVAQAEQTTPTNTYTRSGHTTCDGSDWLYGLSSSGAQCSGVDPNACPIIGSDSGNPTWAANAGNEGTVTSVPFGSTAAGAQPYGVLSCNYQITDFQTANDINTMYNPQTFPNQHPGTSGNYGPWLNQTAVNQQMDGSVMPQICNRQVTGTCPGTLINPVTNTPVTTCSQMISTDPIGVACRSWIGRVGSQANSVMQSYCQNNNTLDCVCINPQGDTTGFYSSIWNAIASGLNPALPGNGNPGCFWKPCNDPVDYLVPTTYLNPTGCPANCDQIIQNWGNVNSTFTISGGINSVFTCDASATSGVTGTIQINSPTSPTTPATPNGTTTPVSGTTTPATTSSSIFSKISKKWWYIIAAIVAVIIIIIIIAIIIGASRKGET